MLRYTGPLLTLIALGLSIGARPAHGQTMTFFRQFTTPGMDRATAVAADASGIYVVGYRQCSQGRCEKAAVRKYDLLGTVLWTQELTASTSKGETFLVSVAAHLTGVYVLGSIGAGDQWVVRKYSPGGTELWSRQLDNPAGLAADAGGVYVYVTGPNFPSSPYLRKYDHEGTELWTILSPSGEGPRGVTVDGTAVYVLARIGRSEGFLPDELVLRKYDARGNPWWTRRWSVPVWSVGLATDGSGVYVVNDPGTGEHSLLKYDAAGNRMWMRQLGKFYSGGVTADATGVYIAGFRDYPHALPGQCASGSGGDSFVRKYDLNGGEVWTRQFGTAHAAWASGVAVDAGSVYVVGREGTAMFVENDSGLELTGLLAPPNSSSGAFIAKFEKTAAPAAGPGPRIFPDCVVNAASYVGGGVAPGEMVTLFGSAMGPSELVPLRVTEDRRLATTLADTRILFNGVAAPLLYVSDKQSSAIVPYAIADRTWVDVQVEHAGVRSDAVTAPVLASRPGIFSVDSTGQGQGAILNEDGTVNSPSNPALRGSIITIFGTGGGEADPGLVDGEIVSGVVPRASLPVSAFFARGLTGDWGQGEVLYAGSSPGSVAGLLQVNVRVPANAGAGERVYFALIIGSHWTVFQTTVALR
ncbi:MAG: hypothetical protein K2X35_18025 [Bryobacteraceae bacterium]|nr:hypothetical protein [Bryobacteraceae bacterium]